jgi:hypothetical protein
MFPDGRLRRTAAIFIFLVGAGDWATFDCPIDVHKALHFVFVRGIKTIAKGKELSLYYSNTFIASLLF